MLSLGRRTFLGGIAALGLTGAAGEERGQKVGRVERIDPALDRIIDPAATITIIATGLRWAEGPTWVKRDNSLLFGDPGANIVYRWREGGRATPFLSPSGLQTPVPPALREPGLNGIAIDASGALIGADSGTRAIVRVDMKTKARTILADRYQGKRLNSPNDLCIARSGAIYFTDPTYGLREGDTSPLREVAQCGLYRLDPDGQVTLIEGAYRRPNGVALSPDERTLYLALSDEKMPEMRAYMLDDRGAATGQRLFYDMRAQFAAGLPGLPDGIKVMGDGTIFATGPGGVHVLTPDGRAIGLISTGRAIANCCIGMDGRALFLTSKDIVAMLPLRRG
jgi:gluconolactonase